MKSIAKIRKVLLKSKDSSFFFYRNAEFSYLILIFVFIRC